MGDGPYQGTSEEGTSLLERVGKGGVESGFRFSEAKGVFETGESENSANDSTVVSEKEASWEISSA